MPIYEYECSECGHKLEVMQRMSDARLKTCPSCHEDALVKLVSAAGFQLKGTGWYETDFKNKGRPEKKSGEGDADKSSGKDGESATDKTSARDKDKAKGGDSDAGRRGGEKTDKAAKTSASTASTAD